MDIIKILKGMENSIIVYQVINYVTRSDFLCQKPYNQEKWAAVLEALYYYDRSEYIKWME